VYKPVPHHIQIAVEALASICAGKNME